MPFSEEMPSPVGPRKQGQSLPVFRERRSPAGGFAAGGSDWGWASLPAQPAASRQSNTARERMAGRPQRADPAGSARTAPPPPALPKPPMYSMRGRSCQGVVAGRAERGGGLGRLLGFGSLQADL